MLDTFKKNDGKKTFQKKDYQTMAAALFEVQKERLVLLPLRFTEEIFTL